MKLLKHYVSDVHQKKVLPIAELRGRLRRQPNTCVGEWFHTGWFLKKSTLNNGCPLFGHSWSANIQISDNLPEKRRSTKSFHILLSGADIVDNCDKWKVPRHSRRKFCDFDMSNVLGQKCLPFTGGASQARGPFFFCLVFKSFHVLKCDITSTLLPTNSCG